MSAPSRWFRNRWTTLAGAAAVCAVAPLARFGDVDIARVVFVVVFVILSLSLHEAAHAWTAWKCGDSTARDLGRVTLNPLVSIDPIMTILVPAMLVFSGLPAFGGAKPVPVSYHRLRHPLRDMMFVAIAGPLTNVLIAVVFAVTIKSLYRFAGGDGGPLLYEVLRDTLVANAALAVFNMIPIPPLDGSRVMAWLLPSGLREPYVHMERFGMFLVIGFVVLMNQVPALQHAFYRWTQHLVGAIDFLTGGNW